MRQVKFRAWDGEIMGGIMYMKFPLEDCGIVIMQYTGLKDRNDKEIYEGDIVEVSRYENDERYLVQVKDIRIIPDLLLGSYVNWKEVIGNIYETPELLKEG